MTRHAFKMKLKPGVIEEYKRRHDEIWPELAKELRAAGISDHSIFLDEETLTLFAVQKTEAASFHGAHYRRGGYRQTGGLGEHEGKQPDEGHGD